MFSREISVDSRFQTAACGNAIFSPPAGSPLKPVLQARRHGGLKFEVRQPATGKVSLKWELTTRT